MGKILHTEKSADNRFQWTLWQNEESGKDNIIEVRKFFTRPDGKIDFKRFDFIRFQLIDFDKFKDWIVKFKK